MSHEYSLAAAKGAAAAARKAVMAESFMLEMEVVWLFVLEEAFAVARV